MEGREGERLKERERVFHLLVRSSNNHNDQGCTRPKPGASPLFTTWVQRPKDQGHPRLLSQAHEQVTGLEMEQLGLKCPPPMGCWCERPQHRGPLPEIFKFFKLVSVMREDEWKKAYCVESSLRSWDILLYEYFHFKKSHYIIPLY